MEAEKAGTPEAWEAKLDTLLNGPKPQLKALRALLSEGEKVDWELNGLEHLKEFVEECSEVAEEALSYTTRRQQNRRKKERAWSATSNAEVATAAEADGEEREYRNFDSIKKLLTTANNLHFVSPEIFSLRERYESITEFQNKARAALREGPAQFRLAMLDELLEEGKAFNVDLPELDSLENVVERLKWSRGQTTQVVERLGWLRGQTTQVVERLGWLSAANEIKFEQSTLQEVTDLIAEGRELGIPDHPNISFLQGKKIQGELWEASALELMLAENVHYQRLDALSKKASTLPVTPETLAAVDAILKKQPKS
ncbi:PLU-1-like protein [Byssothecium circinans]|uniref:PLU-1-like protein n=1 Tax=Byssothecium circinans TaxID=147558 RepID=A0A6A5UDZ4_9PLEO|nr:PLU-1-like protein [Byssothecium circinans]